MQSKFPHQLSEFYVYVHRRSDTGAVFYVGKGSGYRGLDFRNRSPEWHAARRCTDVLAQVVDHSMNSLQASTLEAALIDFILRSGGSLANKNLVKEPVRWAPRQQKPQSTRPQRCGQPIRCVTTGEIFQDAEAIVSWATKNGRPGLKAKAVALAVKKTGALAGRKWEFVKTA